MADTSLRKLIEGFELEPAEEQKLLKSLDPASLVHVCKLMTNQKRQLREELKTARDKHAELEAALRELRAPPLHPATVLGLYPDGRVEVAIAGRRQVVVTMPEIPASSLRTGAEILLNAEFTTVVGLSESGARIGVVGTVTELIEGVPMIRGANDEEILAMCDPELAASLKVGDRVLYTRGVPCTIERLPERTDNPYLLEEPPKITFESIGGLEDVITDIRQYLDLTLLFKDQVAAYHLEQGHGILLVGPPGVGKSMIAEAAASYLVQCGVDARFLYVRPGALRSMWYGQSEARIRELFAVAKAWPGLVVIFFDELDTFGSRGVGVGQGIDGRVQNALLSEINGLESAKNIICVGATNRLDLCDRALVRHGRFGDRVYRIPRPGREATQQILSKYLTDNLPYASNGGEGGGAALLIDAAVSYLHAPAGGAEALATVTFDDGGQREVVARDVLSGALIASAVGRAKYAAAYRHLEGGSGITVEDMLEALGEALTSEARKLDAVHVARETLDFPGAERIVRIELARSRRVRRHRYVRAA
jgi:proteasome-associated ATPase